MTDVLARYLDQPDALPAAALQQVQSALPQARLCRIALVDLDAQLQFKQR